MDTKTELYYQRANWQLQSLLDCSIHGVIVLKKGVIQYANRASAKILATKVPLLKGQDFILLMNHSFKADPEVDFSHIRMTDDKIDESKNRFSILLTDQGQEKKWIQLWAIDLAFDEETSVSINMIDVTKMVKTELQMIQTEKIATIGQLAGGVAHEINNPLSYIRSNMETMKEYVYFFEQYFGETQKYFNEIINTKNNMDNKVEQHNEDMAFFLKDSKDLLAESLKGIDKAAQIIKDIQSFAGETNNEYQFQEIDIHALLASIENVIWNQVKYTAILKKEMDAQKTHVAGDPQQLGQVFINLILNSVQAILDRKKDETDLRGEIVLRTFNDQSNESQSVIMEILDNGSGISKENLIKIFDPFFTTKKIGTATGMGLSLSYDIVRRHFGKMSVQSEYGQGTTFRIILPVLV